MTFVFADCEPDEVLTLVRDSSVQSHPIPASCSTYSYEDSCDPSSRTYKINKGTQTALVMDWCRL